MAFRSGRGVGAGDGYDTFFRTVFPRAVAVTLRVTGERSSAEDAALDALAKAHFRWSRVSGLERPDLWVIKVAARAAIRQLRRDDRPAADRAVMTTSAAALDPAEAVAVRQALTVALRALPRRQCEVIVLRYLVGLSEIEVAEALEISPGTVKTHLRRGMAALRRSVGNDFEEEHLARLA
jgi:RNA polymerase sigma factor (sigma-70 family)